MTGVFAGFSIARISLLSDHGFSWRGRTPEIRPPISSNQTKTSREKEERATKAPNDIREPGLGALVATICGMDILIQIEIAIRCPFCHSSVFISAITDGGKWRRVVILCSVKRRTFATDLFPNHTPTLCPGYSIIAHSGSTRTKHPQSISITTGPRLAITILC